MRFVQFVRSSGEIVAILEMTWGAAQLQRTDQLDVIADEQAQPQRHRINPATKTPYEYVPPQPDEDHDWDAEKWRWVLKPSIQEQRLKRLAAKAEIQKREAQGQRAIREAVIAILPMLPVEQASKFQRVIDMDRDISNLAVESGLRGDSQ